MKIASHQLAAFFETARLHSFSRAAEHLAVTQSALSQRIAHLEDELGATLFIRDSGGPKLTTAGETLLRYCQVNDSLEQEVLSELRTSTAELSGRIRIAAFSSVLRSVVIPALAPFLRAHPRIRCEFRSYEMNELFEVLKNAEADLTILDYPLKRAGIVEHVLGREEYVVIKSARYDGNENIFLDHGPHDTATETFFRAQDAVENKVPRYRRSFMGDVHGIIAGVEMGLGRAVMSKHLVRRNPKVKILRGYKRFFCDVTLHYFEQPYYSRLHSEIVRELGANCGGLLDSP